MEDNKNLGISFLEINEISLVVANHIGKVSEENIGKGESLKNSILELFRKIVNYPAISKKIVKKEFSMEFLSSLKGKSDSFFDEYERKLSGYSSKLSVDGNENLRKKLKKNDGNSEDITHSETETQEKINKK